MKLRKKSGLTLGIIALSAAAITSVGFAAWVITAGAQAERTGSFIVDTVEDHRLEVAVTSASEVKFAGAKDADVSTWEGVGGALNGRTIWLQNSNIEEQLVAEVVFTISPASGAVLPSVDFDDYTITYPSLTAVQSDGTTASTAYATCVTNSLVTSLETVKASVVTTGVDAASTSGSIVVTAQFTFAWGDAFKDTSKGDTAGVNPYLYYNRQDYSVSLGNDAKTKLGQIADLEANLYKLTIDVKAN